MFQFAQHAITLAMLACKQEDERKEDRLRHRSVGVSSTIIPKYQSIKNHKIIKVLSIEVAKYQERRSETNIKKLL